MQKLNKKEILSILNIAARLFIVCTIIAAVVGSVNYITKDIIEAHELEKTYAALDSVFKNNDNQELDYKKQDIELSASVTGLYEVHNSVGIIGYGVLCEPTGFKDVIKMLVAFNNDTSIASVEIISLSETAGIGDKVKNDPSFTEQFSGLKNSISFGVDVKAIAGATVSSKAVTQGVNDAVSVLKLYTADKSLEKEGEANGK